MKKYLSILLLFLSHYVFAQNNSRLDELKKRLATAKEDTTIIKLQTDLAFEITEVDRAKAIAYLSEAGELSKKIGYKKGTMLVTYGYAMVLDYESKFDSSRRFYEEAASYAKALNDKKWEVDAYINIGLSYIHESKFPEGMAWYDKAQNIAEEINNPSLLAKVYRKKANLLTQTLEFKQAINFIHRSIIIYKQVNDSATLGETYGSLGWVYKNCKQYDSSIFYMEEAIAIFKATRYITFIPVAYTEIGIAHYEQGKYEDAIINFTAAEKIYDTLNYPAHQDALHVSHGNALVKLQRYKEAETHYQEGLSLARDTRDMEYEVDALYGLYLVNKGSKNYVAGIRYFEQYDSARALLANKEQLARVTEMTEKYENEKKEKQIQQQKFELTRKNYWLFGSMTILLLGLLLGYSYYRRYKLRQEKKLHTEIIKQQDISTKAVLQAEENERQRIAQELHDGVGQMMSAAKMNLSSFEADLRFEDEKQKIAYEKVISLVDESCREIRSISHQMMPNALLKRGLSSAIKEFIDKIDTRILKINLYTEGLNERLDSNVETVLYRVIQECVNNVIKHSGANTLDISLIRDADGIAATIEDNGKGFDTNDKQKFEGIGLKNISSRVGYLKGTVDFDSSPNRGTLIAIHVPVS